MLPQVNIAGHFIVAIEYNLLSSSGSKHAPVISQIHINQTNKLQRWMSNRFLPVHTFCPGSQKTNGLAIYHTATLILKSFFQAYTLLSDMLQQSHCGVKLFLAKVALMFFMTASMTGNQITAGLGRNRDDTIQQRSPGSVTMAIFKSMLLTYMLQQIFHSAK